MPDLPGRGGDRRTSERGGFGSEFGGGERRERREPFAEGDGKVRDFGNWERRGPLSPLPQQDRAPRDGGRPRTNEGPMGEGLRDRKSSPAAWGEGRPQQGSQDGGSRPPRREFQERPAVERTPTAAEQDSQWRTKMRPDAPAAKSPVPSRDGSEAPSSPALGSAAPAGRPKLNLAKRTISEAPDQASSTASVSGDSKPNPFGGAAPVDTVAREREIEEKRLAAIQEKKEAEEKAKADAREAAKAAKASAEAEKAERAENDKKIEILKKSEGEDASKEGETIEKEDAHGEIVDDKAVKPKEIVRDVKPRPSDSGAWRRASGGPPGPRDDNIPRGPRGGRGGRGVGRGPRGYHDEGRGGRQNSNGRPPPSPAAAPQTPTTDTETGALAEDGWSTVSKPKKNNRGGNQGSRAIAS